MAVTGAGSQLDPHIVTTWADLVSQSGIAGTIDNIHYVKLGNDINMKDIPLSTYWEIKNCVDVDGGGYALKNIQITHNDSYFGIVKANTSTYSGSTYVLPTLHNIAFENLLYTNTSGMANSYGLFCGVGSSSSPDNILGKMQFTNIKMSGKLVYTVAPTTVIGFGGFENNSFNFDYYAPKLPTRGFIGAIQYDNYKIRNELRYKAYLSSTIDGILWGQGGYNINYSKFQYNSLFAEIIALEGCVTTTPPKLFYNASSYKLYPLDCYCMIKSNVNGLTIPISSDTTYLYPTRLLYQNDGENIVTIDTTGMTSPYLEQVKGLTTAQLKDFDYLTSIGFALTNEV